MSCVGKYIDDGGMVLQTRQPEVRQAVQLQYSPPHPEQRLIKGCAALFA